MDKSQKRCSLIVLAALAVGFGACAPDGNGPSEDAGGGLSLALTLVPNVRLESVGYSITGPNGFTQAGTIDVADSTTAAAVIGPLPTGTSFAIALTATSVDGSETCGGSAMFDVVAGQTAPVLVHLLCHEAPQSGSILVTGSVNVCPQIDGVAADPVEVSVGSSVQLSAVAHDADAAPTPLTYQWTANTGTVEDASASSTRFTCTNPGPATIVLTVSDGDLAATCSARSTVTVVCSPIGDNGGGPPDLGSDLPCLVGGNVIFFDGDPGSYVHPGKDTITQGLWSASASTSTVHVGVTPTDPAQGLWWDLYFDSSQLVTPALATRIYLGAERWPFQSAGHPGLDISGDGRGCNTVTGSFQIEGLEMSGGALTSFTATFEHHCEGGAAALRGCVHWGL
jgi:hypothetical protein